MSTITEHTLYCVRRAVDLRIERLREAEQRTQAIIDHLQWAPSPVEPDNPADGLQKALDSIRFEVQCCEEIAEDERLILSLASAGYGDE